MQQMRFIALLWICFGFLACSRHESVRGFVDQELFSRVGGTLFTTPAQVTMKEIHLDSGNLSGRDVVIEGTVTEVGKFGTFVVMADETARLLIILTYLPSGPHIGEQQLSKSVRILGTVENGKKGMPFLTARSINIVASGEKA